MRTLFKSLMGLAIVCFIVMNEARAQDETPASPQYLTITTAHWNMDYDDFDMDEWKAVEKEYFDKVTSKNKLIMGSGYYLHRFTPDNREIVVVNVFGSWEDIDKAGEQNSQLVKEGWPDEEARKAYFKKRNAYYSNFHSDEIYATQPHAKPYNGNTAEVVLVRVSHLAYPEDGTFEEFNALSKEYIENVFHKNEYIQGYYPWRHAWGANSTEYSEAFFVNNLADLDKMYQRNNELFMEHWPDEAKRQEMGKKAGKYFTGVHGDYIYTIVKELYK